MTYCFAWKYQDAAFLIADTLVTQNTHAPGDLPTTSMGEPHKQVGRDEFVHERALKIRELKEGVAVAIAGNEDLGLIIADFMQDHITTCDKASDVFKTVEASLAPFHPDRRVQMLLIEGAENGECSITKWDTQTGCEDVPRWAYIGSLQAAQANNMADLFHRVMADKQPSKEAMLMAGIAHVNSLSQHEDLIEQHVGGVVCGLRVQRAKTIWPEDLIIVHLKGGLSSIIGRISVHVREGIMYINSTYHGAKGSVFVNKHANLRTDDLIQSWHERWWQPYLKDYLSQHFTTCTRWLFINLDHQVPLVFVVHGKLEQASNDLRITRKDSGEYDVTFASELGNMLRREVPSTGVELRIVEVINPAEPLPDGMKSANKSIPD